jgi:hypothetical protein
MKLKVLLRVIGVVQLVLGTDVSVHPNASFWG